MIADSCPPLTFFPDIQADETIYSACTRYHFRSGYSDSATTSTRLLGHARGGKHQDLPVGVARLSRLTGGAIAANETTLRERTVLRAYLPLMSSARREKVVGACLRSTKSVLAKAYSGLSYGVTTDHRLRHCFECLQAQYAKHGFAFWRTSHQLPGVWVCPDHQSLLVHLPERSKKRTDWVRVDRSALRELPHEAVAVTRRLSQVSSVMQWISNSERLHVDALVVMVRARLHEARHTRSDMKATDEELARVHKTEVAPLALCGVSQFQGFRYEGWISSCLVDERASHPLKWAVLLGISGEVDHSALSRAYAVATERISQPGLFDHDYRPRRSRAPEAAYTALTGPVTVAEAAQASGMRASELQAWLRRDEMLSQHWRATDFDVRRRAAIFTIEGCTTANPKMMRSQVMARCLWAVRWLEQNDRQMLNLLLPASQPKYARQFRLQFDD